MRAGVAAGPPSPLRWAGRTGVPERAGVPAQRRYDGGPAGTPAGRAVPGASRRLTTHLPHVGSVASGRNAAPGVVQRRGGRSRRRAIMQGCQPGACRSAGTPVDIPEESWGSVALELHPAQAARRQAVQDIGTPSDGVRDRLERILASYEEMDRRFSAAGGLGSLLNLYEQVRRELERVSFEELDRMTLEIKTVIEALLKMDYELRKVHNLKLAFETRPPGAGALG